MEADLDLIGEIEVEGGLRQQDMKRLVEVFAKHGFAYSMFSGNDLVMIGGAVLNVAPGVAEIWSIRKLNAWMFPVVITRGMRKIINDAFDKGMHRVQSSTHADFVQSIRWHQRAGMVVEGVKHSFGIDGSDYVIMGIWK